MNLYLKSKLKKLYLRLAEDTGHLRKSIECNHVWYGNDYGGFFVHPDILDASSVVYSFGIGEDISFDNMIIEIHDCKVHCFDPTPKSIKWMKSQKLHDNIRFHEYGVSKISGPVDFFLPRNPEHISGSIVMQDNVDVNGKITVQMKSVKDIVSELQHDHIDMLKMDIEGAEYEIMNDILDFNIPVRQVLIEFHDRLFQNGRAMSKGIVERMRSIGFEIFAVSDSLEEVSFINKNAL